MTFEPIMDKLQWIFDRLFALIPRRLAPDAVEPLLVGHRGVFGHPEVQENTFAAFDIAIARGGGIEFDLHLTRDGVVVVHHDATLLRVHGRPEAIADLTLNQLQELAPAVPTFDELLARYGHGCPHYFLEPKVRELQDMRRLVRALGQGVSKARLDRHATLISSHTAMLDVAREELPWLPRAIIFFATSRAAERYARQHGDTGMAGWYFNFPKRMMAELAQRGLHMGVGQIDYLNTHRHYRNLGFRYHFTNRIDRLVAAPVPLSPPPRPALLTSTR